VAPYQVQLDDGRLIYAPTDDNRLIRALGEDEDDEEASPPEILVCQAGSCRRAGSEAVLLEIEELASSVGAAVVQASGCVGNCSNAPNALVVDHRGENMFAELCNIEKSAKVIAYACGRAPNLDDVGTPHFLACSATCHWGDRQRSHKGAILSSDSDAS